MNENDKLIFDQLKQILLEEDRMVTQQSTQKLLEKIREVELQLNERELLEKRIRPILLDNEKHLQEKFPELFGKSVTAAIKKQIKESEKEVIEALYPIAGKLVKKYIKEELFTLSDKIDNRAKELFSLKRIINWFKHRMADEVEDEEIILADRLDPIVEEVFIIQKDSGYLVASYSNANVVDNDLVSGLLTATRSYIENPFVKKNNRLDIIQHSSYTILLFTFSNFYIAVTMSGPVSDSFNRRIEETVYELLRELTTDSYLYIKDINYEELLRKLANAFYVYGKH